MSLILYYLSDDSISRNIVHVYLAINKNENLNVVLNSHMGVTLVNVNISFLSLRIFQYFLVVSLFLVYILWVKKQIQKYILRNTMKKKSKSKKNT